MCSIVMINKAATASTMTIINLHLNVYTWCYYIKIMAPLNVNVYWSYGFKVL